MEARLVYFDMDGVLADFDEAYDRLIGERLPNGDVIWDRVREYPTFFHELRPMDGMRLLWDIVPSQERRILSSIPKSIDESSNGKRAWLNRHVVIDPQHIHLVRGKKLKQAFARPGHILIDDWEPNIVDWRLAGGIGIHFRNIEQAVDDLRRELYGDAILSPLQALRLLVRRLEEVHSDPRYMSVWQMYALHGGRYTEPMYDKELNQAKRTLAEAGKVDA